MPIDASIYNAFAPRVQSPLDVQNGLMQQANAGLQMQQQRDAMAQSYAEQDALRSTGGDPAAMRQALIARGLVKPLMAHDKSQADLANTQAQQKERESQAQLHQVDASTKKLAEYRSLLPMVQNPQDFAQWVDGMYANPLTRDAANQMGTPEQVKARIPQDPAGFQQFLQKNAMGMDKFIADQTQKRGQDMTAQTHLQTTQMTNDTSRANNAATVAGSYGVAALHEKGQNARNAATIAAENLRAGIGADGVAPGGEDATIKAIGEYRMAPPTLQALRNPRIAAMMDKVNAQFPGYDSTQYGMRAKAVKDYATGKQGQEVTSANTAVNHLATLRELAAAQKNGDIRVVNDVLNRIGKEFGTTAPSNMQAAVTLVGPEISKAVIGAGGGQGDRERVDAALAAMVKGGPAQAEGTVATLEDIFGGRLTEAQRSYERSTKMNDFETSLLSPAAAKVLARKKAASTPGRTVSRTGVDANGKKVIQYSDGTIEHAN